MSGPFSSKLADGTRWPVDVEAIGEIAHRLRYGEPHDFNAAAVIDAYLYLITSDTRTQREKLRLIRLAQAPEAGGGKEGERG